MRQHLKTCHRFLVAYLKSTRAWRQGMRAAAKEAVRTNPYVGTYARRRMLKKLSIVVALIAGGSVGTSALTMYNPDLVSAPLDDYAATLGVEGSFQALFETKGIRVYDRESRLVPFHRAGWSAVTAYRSATSLPGQVFYPVFAYGLNFWDAETKGVGSDVQLDAHATLFPQADGNYACFIRPAGAIDSSAFFTELSDSSLRLIFKESAQIKRYYKLFALAHEARHCDQNGALDEMLRESDADLVGVQVASAAVGPQQASDLVNYIAALRVVNTVLIGSTGHYTAPPLVRGDVTPFQAIEDRALMGRFLLIMRETEVRNTLFVLTQKTDYIEVRYHLARAILAATPEDDQATRYCAEMFIGSVDYLNGMAGGKFITTPHEKVAAKIDVSWMARESQPASVSPQTAAAPSSAAPKTVL